MTATSWFEWRTWTRKQTGGFVGDLRGYTAQSGPGKGEASSLGRVTASLSRPSRPHVCPVWKPRRESCIRRRIAKLPVTSSSEVSAKGQDSGQVDWSCLTHKEPQPHLVPWHLPSLSSPSSYTTVRRLVLSSFLYSLPTGIALLFASLHFLFPLSGPWATTLTAQSSIKLLYSRPGARIDPLSLPIDSFTQ